MKPDSYNHFSWNSLLVTRGEFTGHSHWRINVTKGQTPYAAYAHGLAGCISGNLTGSKGARSRSL